jgi:hypothetical protein
MKIIRFLLVAGLLVVFVCSVYAQHSSDHSQPTMGVSFWTGVLELPFLFLCVFFAFKTSIALKGGVFGKGMSYLAWGFLVMAVGHLHMQADHFFGFNLFNTLLGQSLGKIVWFIALVVTWGLSGYGFYEISRASKGRV